MAEGAERDRKRNAKSIISNSLQVRLNWIWRTFIHPSKRVIDTLEGPKGESPFLRVNGRGGWIEKEWMKDERKTGIPSSLSED